MSRAPVAPAFYLTTKGLTLPLRRVNQVLDVFGLVAVLFVPDAADEKSWTKLTIKLGSYAANCNEGKRRPWHRRLLAAIGAVEDA